jgi:hypothetical protein
MGMKSKAIFVQMLSRKSLFQVLPRPIRALRARRLMP